MKELLLWFALSGFSGNLDLPEDQLSDVDWMARQIYFEAGNATNDQQMYNVGLVVINRWYTYEWGETIESVITHNCEFSWYCDGRSDKLEEHFHNNILERNAIIKSYFVAYSLVNGNYHTDFTGFSLYYHAKYEPGTDKLMVVPGFFRKLNPIYDDGLHIFYEE